MLVRRLPGAVDPLPLARARPDRYPVLLQSAASNARARHDVLCAFPREALVADGRGDFLARFDAAWRREALPAAPPGAPAFRGGWVLLLGYELASEIEPRLSLPAPALPMPQAIALRCPAALVVDRVAGETLLVAEVGQESLLDAMSQDLRPSAPATPAPVPALRAVAEDPPGRFLQGVARIREYLAAGDVFQVNLSRGWRLELDREDPAAVYGALRAANPAPFAGLFVHASGAVASSSPERLLAVRGRRVETRPIAGTRPRLPGDDELARRRELAGHPKERAEHVMLLDLERNDLGRVCVPGSVEVDELMSIESYAHVHHLVSNVRGVLRPEARPAQAIAAVFPGGTITGCPKLRSMEIIAELEGEGRGPYTGAMGYVNRDGDLDLNILIRSVQLAGNQARLRAGSGIVADSDPMRELEETRAKARGLLRAFGIEG